LHVDQLEILQTELSLAVLGLSSREEFVKDTMKEAHIPSETMVKLVSDINTEIFEPIRVYLHQNLKPEQNTLSETDTDDSADELHDSEKVTLQKHGIELDTNEPKPLSHSEIFQKKEHEKREVSAENEIETKSRNIKEKDFVQNSEETKKKPVVKSFSNLLEDDSSVSFQSQDEDLSSVKAFEYTEQEGYIPQDVDHLGPYEPKSSAEEIQNTKDGVYATDPYREPVE
jgi:CRISPR/Cas system-associated exonuclease Cas4 (RecB family)